MLFTNYSGLFSPLANLFSASLQIDMKTVSLELLHIPTQRRVYQENGPI